MKLVSLCDWNSLLFKGDWICAGHTAGSLAKRPGLDQSWIGEMNSHMGVLSNVLISGKRNVIDLEYYREGRHYIIYRNTAAGLYVLDFVHSSRDLESIIQDLYESNRIDFLSQRLKPNSRLVTQVPAQTL